MTSDDASFVALDAFTQRRKAAIKAAERLNAKIGTLRRDARTTLLSAVSLLDSLDSGASGQEVLAGLKRARKLLLAAETARASVRKRPKRAAHPSSSPASSVSNIYGSTARSMYPTKGPRRTP